MNQEIDEINKINDLIDEYILSKNSSKEDLDKLLKNINELISLITKDIQKYNSLIFFKDTLNIPFLIKIIKLKNIEIFKITFKNEEIIRKFFLSLIQHDKNKKKMFYYLKFNFDFFNQVANLFKSSEKNSELIKKIFKKFTVPPLDSFLIDFINYQLGNTYRLFYNSKLDRKEFQKEHYFFNQKYIEIVSKTVEELIAVKKSIKKQSVDQITKNHKFKHSFLNNKVFRNQNNFVQIFHSEITEIVFLSNFFLEKVDLSKMDYKSKIKFLILIKDVIKIFMSNFNANLENNTNFSINNRELYLLKESFRINVKIIKQKSIRDKVNEQYSYFNKKFTCYLRFFQIILNNIDLNSIFIIGSLRGIFIME